MSVISEITLEQFSGGVEPYLRAKRYLRHQRIPFLCAADCDCFNAPELFEIMNRKATALADAALEMTPEGEAIPYDGSHLLGDI